MAYHRIIFTCKDSIEIPEKHKQSLNEFGNEIYPDVTLSIDKTTVSFWYPGVDWLYEEDIDDLIQDNKLTFGMIEAYKWLKENTHVYSDCHNLWDWEMGSNCWEDIERRWDYLENKSRLDYLKNKMKEIETKLNK